MSATVLITRLPENAIYELTGYLDNDSAIELSQEEERDAFERVVDDVHLRLSNQSGIFHSTIFGNSTPANRWIIKIIDADSSRVLFLGDVDPTTVLMDVKTEWVEFDAFSATRLFWDECDFAKIGRFTLSHFFEWTLGSSDYVTVQNFLTYLFGPFGSSLTYRTVNAGVFANRTIRCGSNNPTLNNLGRLRELNPAMSVKQLLEGMAIYYNAEFYVDPDTELVMMVPRNIIRTSSVSSIDSIIEDDVEMAVEWSDSHKADYIYTYAQIAFDPPSLSQYILVSTGGGVSPGEQHYVITHIINGVEQFVSWPGLQVDLPPAAPNALYRVGLIVPTAMSSVTRRNIYRWDVNNAYNLGYRLIGFVDGYFETSFLDLYNHDGFAQRTALSPNITNVASVWMGYDEPSGLWTEPILDVGDNQPSGKIVDVRPQIQFTAIGDPETLLAYSPLQVLKFFGSDNTIENIHQQFLEMLLLKRRLRTTVKGTNFKVGDGYESAILSTQGGLGIHTRYVVKKAVMSLPLAEKTRLEMVPA